MAYDALFTRSLAQLGAAASPEDDWWFPPDPGKPLVVRPAAGPCRRALFTTKLQWTQWIFPAGTLPADVMLIVRYGMLPAALVRLLRRELAVAGCPLHFVGDLDPLDLSVYLTLTLGGIEGESSDEPPLDVKYLGVNDAWLALCEEHLAHPRKSQDLMATLPPFERLNLQWLEAQGVDWDAVVGPRAMALLRSGWKLEIEGAANPRVRDEAFPARLRAFLLGEGVVRGA